MRKTSYPLIFCVLFSLLFTPDLIAQPFWVTSIGGSGWSGTLANNATDNSTVYSCYNSGLTLYSNTTVASIVSGTKTYYRKWQYSSDGSSWFTTTGGVSSYSTSSTISRYYRVCYSYNSSSTDILYPSPWVHHIFGPQFVSMPSAVSTTNETSTSFTANWTTSSTPHGPGNLVIRHYMFCSTTPTFTSGTQAPGFNSSCAKLITSCSESTAAIPGCTNPTTAVSYTVTGLTPGVVYYWKIIAQSWHEDSSNGDLWCGYQSSYTSTQEVGCTAPVIASQPASQAICNGSTGTLTVTATGATSYQWQLNGTDIAGATSSSYSPSTAGTYTCWTYSACDSTQTSAAVVTIDEATIANAGPDQALCANNASLAANTPLSGTGTWSVISGSGTFDNPNSPTTTVSGLTAGANTFVWTLLNGACSDSRDTVVITMQTASTDPTGISGTTSICSGSSTTLSVNGGSLGTGANWQWFEGSCGSGSALGTGSSITVSPTANTSYYVVSQGGCNTTSCVSQAVTVTPISADAGADLTLCTGDTATLTVSGTGTYQWSYGGFTTATISFVPAASGTYTVTVTNGSCTAQDAVNVTVTTAADASILTSGTICTNQAPFILSSVDAGGTWSGQGITNSSTGMFSALTAGPGTHQIIHTISGSCGDSDTTMLTVAASSDATITPAGPFCSNVSSVTLVAATPGGTWSGLGITNTATGQFSPSSVGAGSYNVIYTIAGTCGDDDTLSITINTAPNSTITSTGPFCSNVASVVLSAATPGGTWSGQGITNGVTGTFSPQQTGAGTFNVFYTIAGTCGSSDTASITVANGSNATINPAGPFCANTPSTTLNAVTPGGVWSGLGITNSSTGSFSPLAVGPGSYNVIYTISGTCGDDDTLTITVNAASNATITPAGPFCSSVNSVSLTAAGSGGLWSGQGITNAVSGTFSPAGVGAGSWDIVYTITGSCGDSDTITIVVNNAFDATINPAGPFCYTDAVVNLTAGSTGGTWSGSGIINSSTGSFNPALAGPGTHLITYMISGTCGDTAAAFIVVDSIRDASILSPTSYCDNIAVVSLSSATAGGLWSGSNVNATGQFYPSVAGPGNYQVIYTLPGSCGSADTVTLRVNDAPVLTLTGTTESCTGSQDGSANATVTGGTSPYSYFWNTNETTALISQLEAGTWSVEITDANGCRVADSVTLDPSTVDCNDINGVVYIPNIFAPNSTDPSNTSLFIFGQGIKNIDLKIYDRWGELIFESKDIKVGWDGTYKGKDMDQGVYVYMAAVEMMNGELIKKNGNITLVR